MPITVINQTLLFYPDRTIVPLNSGMRVDENCIRTYTSDTLVASRPFVVMDDKETFLSGSRDKTIKLWDVKSGRCIRTYQGHLDTVSTVVSLGSKKFASGSLDLTIKIWSVSGQRVQTLGRHTGEQRGYYIVCHI